MKTKIVNRATLLNGGATSPTIELYQLASGRCRLWWYAFDQDCEESETIAVFNCKDWQRAVEVGREKARAIVAEARKKRQ